MTKGRSDRRIRSGWRAALVWGGWLLTGPVAVVQSQEHPSSSPLVTWEDVLPARGGVVLWARNPTADTVWVDSLHVEECRNVRTRDCGTRALGVVLPPGATRELSRLAPTIPREGFRYLWSLDWHSWAIDSTGVRRRREGSGRPPLVRT